MILKNKYLSQHKKALEKIYSKIDFNESPWGYGKLYIEWIRDSVCKPIYENLNEGTILDSGGGYGFFRKHTRNFHVNLDIAYNIIKYDKSPLKLIGAVEETPFKEKKFDNVVSIGVLRHCFDPSKFIDEAYRVLKDDGKLLIATPALGWPWILNKSPWFIFNVFYITQVGFQILIPRMLLRFYEEIKNIIIDRNQLRKDISLDNNSDIGIVYDRLYSPEELEILLKKNFKILKYGRCGNNLPSQIYPPKSFVEKYFNSNKYGQFLYYICQKK